MLRILIWTWATCVWLYLGIVLHSTPVETLSGNWLTDSRGPAVADSLAAIVFVLWFEVAARAVVLGKRNGVKWLRNLLIICAIWKAPNLISFLLLLMAGCFARTLNDGLLFAAGALDVLLLALAIYGLVGVKAKAA